MKACEGADAPRRSLDSLVRGLPGPLAISVDVEGAELDVLRGAARALRRAAVVVVEAHDGSAPAVAALLRAQHFSVREEARGDPEHPWVVARPNGTRRA